MFRIIYTTDCEGPTCQNDNAYEICMIFLPKGGESFNKISSYDDAVYLLQSKGQKLVEGEYGSGNTLKLVLPFLKAFGLTDRIAEIFSGKFNEIIFSKDAKETHDYIREMGVPVFEISTSYEFFAKPVSRTLKIPIENVFCTPVKLDGYFLPKSEEEKLIELYEDVMELPDIYVTGSECTLNDFGEGSKQSIERLNQIFWHEIKPMRIGKLLEEVVVVDAYKKMGAIKKYIERTGVTRERVMYVGDSITDTEALRYVNQGGGVATSFNGTRYAINESNIACIGESALGLAVLTEAFDKEGKKGVTQIAQNWCYDELKKHQINKELIKKLFDEGRDFEAYLVQEENREELIRRSESKARDLKKRVSQVLYKYEDLAAIHN